MSNFVRILKIIGRALRRAACAVGRFFKFTVKKIAKSIKTSNLGKKIAKKEKAIETLYSEIGRNYYEAHSDAPEALLAELCGSVGENKGLIAEAQEKISALQEAYDAARAEAKEKAADRRASDKAKAKAEKSAAKGEVIEEAAETAAAAPVVTPKAPEPEVPVSAPLIFEMPKEEPAPEAPAEPEAAAEPEVPEAPAAPAESEVPAEPVIPAEPEAAEEPEIPPAPEVPTESEVPVEPEVPAEPEEPAAE